LEVIKKRLRLKNIIFFLFGFLIFCLPSFGADENQTRQDTPSDEFLVSFEKKPTLLYASEVFELRLKALLGSGELGILKTEIANHTGIKLLNSNYKWKTSDDGSQTLSLYFKVIDSEVKLPDITTTFVVGGVEVQKSQILGEPLTAQSVAASPNYCNVIASSLTVANYQIDDYDSKNNILALDISARIANLDDFRIKNVEIQGINNIKSGFENSKMFYYLIIPKGQNRLEFEYFNKDKGRMQSVAVELDLSKIEEKVSTQTDLQPKSGDKALYVFLTVSVIASILYGIYYFKREKIFLILILATVIMGVVFLFIPNERVQIKKDTIVYLLPTENSTAFFKAQIDTPVEKLKESEGYIKVKLEDGKIGWVKGENVVNR